MRTLRTPSVTLEPQTREHAAEMFAVLSDPAIYAYENAPPSSAESLRDRFTRLESRSSRDATEVWLNWVVRLDSRLIGYVQATVYGDGSASIAYEFASEHWGRGLARESVDAVIRELAAFYGVRELRAVAKKANERSLRLLERLGFTPSGQAAEPDEISYARSVTP
jgi:RimJ/RimL family protein N-acetyltransferase